MSKVDGFKTLDPLMQKEKPPRNEKVYEVSKLYEEQFLREMMKSMKNSVQRSDLIPLKMGEQIYQEKLDNEITKSWSQQGGVGIADMIYENIMTKYQKYLPPEGAKPQLPIHKPENLKIHHDQNNSKLKIKMDIPQNQKGVSIQNPWDGKVLSKLSLQNGTKGLVIQHDNGLKSSLFFGGQFNIEIGNQIAKGDNIGVIQNTQLGIDWNLESSPLRLKSENISI